jgi:sugar phosphate isomerase/epimerase
VRIGISTLIDFSVPVETLLKKIKAVGFDLVAIGHSWTHFPYYDVKRCGEIERLLESIDLPVDYVHGPIEKFFDLTNDSESVRASTAAIYRAAIDSCAILRAPYLVVHATNILKIPSADIARRAENAVKPLAEIVEYGGEKGVGLCIENLPANLPYQAVTERILQAYPGDDLLVCFDSSHANMEAHPLRFFSTWSSRVRVLHLSDNSAGGVDEHLVPMKGTFPWAKFIRALADAGYPGSLSLENSDEGNDDFDGYLAESYAAADKLRSMWNAATKKAAASS